MKRDSYLEDSNGQVSPMKRDFDGFAPQRLMKKDLEGFAPQRLMKKDIQGFAPARLMKKDRDRFNVQRLMKKDFDPKRLMKKELWSTRLIRREAERPMPLSWRVIDLPTNSDVWEPIAEVHEPIEGHNWRIEW